MKTEIPEDAIPVQLDDDNRLSTTYSTHTLFPHLGPLGVTSIADVLAGLLKDFSVTVGLVRRIMDWENEQEQPFRVPDEIPPWLVGGSLNPDTDPPRDDYRQLARQLQEYVSPEPGAVATAGHRQGARTQVAATGTINVSEPALRRELSNTTQKELRVDIGRNGMLMLKPLGEFGGLAARWSQLAEQISSAAADGAQPVFSTRELSQEVALRQREWKRARLLHDLSRTGVTTDQLLAASKFRLTGDFLSADMRKISSNGYRDIGRGLVSGLRLPTRDVALAKDWIELTTDRLQGTDQQEFRRELASSTSTRDAVARFVVRVFQLYQPFGLPSLPQKSDMAFLNGREWAFQRTERLDLKLNRPVFRGPFSAESVAPVSTLSESEQTVTSTESISVFRESRGSGRTTGRISSVSRRFNRVLNNLTEAGVQDEGSFSQTSTLLGTLNERRRSLIESVITSVSEENETQQIDRSGSEVTYSRTYTTEGKDADQATTELAFQVVTPVDVSVKVEDVGLVWCPRIEHPFIGLRNLISIHEADAEAEYLEQNLVIDPVRPVENCERATFVPPEIDAEGTERSQTYGFNYAIPPQFSGWEIDRQNCRVSFRNGTSDDYNWDERWNWDDLENWHTEFTRLQQVGDRVEGRVVLTTTDPESWNRGFIRLEFGMMRLDEQTRVALEEYAQRQTETEMQRRAVIVQTKQYARMRRAELIERYENEYDVQSVVFSALIRRIFTTSSAQHRSYWQEVIHSCINWEAAAIRPEHARIPDLPYPEHASDHFLNSPAVRFTLPIHRQSEEAFFDAVRRGAGNYHQESAGKVRNFVDDYRKTIEDLRSSNSDQLELDSFSSEIVLGRHLEAVLSNTVFRE